MVLGEVEMRGDAAGPNGVSSSSVGKYNIDKQSPASETLFEQTLDCHTLQSPHSPPFLRPFSRANENPNSEGAWLVLVLQVACGQTVTSLTACLVNQSLRLDCRHDNATNLPIQYEFSMTRETKKHVLYGTMGVPEHAYRSRTNLTSKYNIKVLYLNGFTNKDEGTYTCEIRLSGQPLTVSNRNVSVLRDKLVKCKGISLAQNTSWLLLLLLSLPLLHAMDFISL
ncbi:Thy-1 membrane glycoprotein [Galemys pyrenaicus]|uniref:Thy-1 membrane glycoprotein n=1 Tax=Galemys pyrenaicus TaxID=202257 RepID=A0A8J6ATJ8_GALPY|nr:Thy-1 membrane glycoprotein [Galemys pyrenaicus]